MVMKGGKWQRALVKEGLLTFLSIEALLRREGDEYWQRGKSGFTTLARLKERVGKNILVSIAANLKFDQQQGSQLCRGTRNGHWTDSAFHEQMKCCSTGIQSSTQPFLSRLVENRIVSLLVARDLSREWRLSHERSLGLAAQARGETAVFAG